MRWIFSSRGALRPTGGRAGRPPRRFAPLAGIRAGIDRRYRAWLDRRLPEVASCRLENRRLFIFPAPAGGLFGALLAVLWLTATNFENNLVFGLTFLLGGLFVVAIFHTYGNLHGVEVGPLHPGTGFAGSAVEVQVELRNPGRRSRERIRLGFAGGEDRTLDLAPGEQRRLRLPVTAPRRGWLDPGRLKVESTHPLGLLRVWSQLRLPGRALIYPQPLSGAALAALHPSATSQGAEGTVAGHEDFAALAAYRPGESRAHIAWKHYARELGLYTKRFTDPVDRRIWLDWHDFPGLDIETRLSRLCGAALAADAAELSYGLRLPDQTIAPASGRAHRDRVLRALALFGLPATEVG
ncbi:MAG TPA: DUF58 domain-containing protein [Porticoccaceae bacterium]|nr:DUF58 domain-containing protein [Porticoccaceae bacterium]